MLPNIVRFYFPICSNMFPFGTYHKGLSTLVKYHREATSLQIFFIIQIYFHALFLNKIGLCFAFFHLKCTETFQRFSKYIGILDLERVGQYWQKPLWYCVLFGSRILELAPSVHLVLRTHRFNFHLVSYNSIFLW